MNRFSRIFDVRALPDFQISSLRLENLPKNEYLFIYFHLYRLCVIHGSFREPGGKDPWLKNY